MRGSLLLRQRLALVVVVVFLAGSLSGCASLRKKFTRPKKNKDQKEEFIPVLEPVDYPKVVETPRQVYRDHYGMLKVYFRELWDVLGRPSGGAKRERYLFGELLSHFDQMAAVLPQGMKDQAATLRGRLEAVLKEYDKPDAMRRYDLITLDVRRIERDIQRTFKPDLVLKDIPGAP